MLNVFISVWVGDYAVFSKFNVFLICLMFLIPGLNNVINIFKDACGLYWQTKYRAVATALVNLVLSLILVKKMGISGVFLGTIIAYLTTIYVKDPVIVFKECFNKKVLTYYIELLVRVSLILVLNLLANQLVDFMSIYFDGIILFFISGIGITIIVNIVFCSLFYKTDEFIFFRNIIFDSIRKII